MVFRRRALAALAWSAASLATSCGNGRPSGDEWSVLWQAQRDALPSADAFLEAGRDGCDDLLGRLRVEIDELRPTPSNAIDEEFDAWAARAESLAFECPSDPDEVASRIDELDVIASSIDAALAVEG